MPFENAERFAELMKDAGNECVLVPFKDKGHGFFNGSAFRKANGDTDYDATLNQSIKFLKTHKLIQ